MTPPDLAIQDGRLMTTARGGRLVLLLVELEYRHYSYEKQKMQCNAANKANSKEHLSLSLQANGLKLIYDL